MVDWARRAAEAKVIDEARALAMRRVESTLRQLRQMAQDQPAGHPRPPHFSGPDMDKTQVIPAVRDEQPEEPEETPAARPPDATTRTGRRPQ